MDKRFVSNIFFFYFKIVNWLQVCVTDCSVVLVCDAVMGVGWVWSEMKCRVVWCSEWYWCVVQCFRCWVEGKIGWVMRDWKVENESAFLSCCSSHFQCHVTLPPSTVDSFLPSFAPRMKKAFSALVCMHATLSGPFLSCLDVVVLFLPFRGVRSFAEVSFAPKC